jgi:restriction system protein
LIALADMGYNARTTRQMAATYLWLRDRERNGDDIVHTSQQLERPTHAWMIRAGDDNELADQIEREEAVAIGWDEIDQDLSTFHNRAAFKARYREAHPDHSDGRVAVNGGQLYRFVCEVDIGHWVLTYIKASRELLIGIIVGDYEYRPDGGGFGPSYPHRREVQWLKRVSRDDFSQAARNSMGSTLTIFSLDDYTGEIYRQVVAGPQPVTEEETSEEASPPYYQEVQAQADELIADLISRLDPYDFQDLVAALLRAMGFRAVSSPPGPDRGVDVVAHPDPFGFEEPRVKVQVKHRSSTVGGPEMRSFLGALRRGDKGLYVSTGGFTRDAEQEAEHSAQPVTLLDRDAFIDLLLEHYPDLDPEFKSKVPLRRIWVPVE